MTTLMWILAIILSSVMVGFGSYVTGSIHGWNKGMEEAEQMLLDEIDRMKESED